MSMLRNLAAVHRASLQKTLSYYCMHIAVAVSVGYVVTGSWAAALALTLLEPTVQAVAYFLHDKAWARGAKLRLVMLYKTVSYYLMHILVAASVAYGVTGDWKQALALSLIEPTVQMVFFYLHERLWERRVTRQRVLSAVG